MAVEDRGAIPQTTGHFVVDEGVIAAFPEQGTSVVNAQYYGESLWGKSARIRTRLPSGRLQDYFLKVISLESTGRSMCEGEFESLKAAHAVSPLFVPCPIAWGRFKAERPETYFLLTEFRNVGEQPAEPTKLAAGLADLHRESRSPTGKFGFHLSTCHAKISQAVDSWEDSWCDLYMKHFRHIIDVARPKMNNGDFNILSKLTLEKVVPRLLLPLQDHGRVLKPCLVHGDCWDGNTAMDTRTGEAFVFDLSSFYGHNEYDTGNWRAPRHRLSNKAFITAYKRRYPMSEPKKEWDWRNLLYSLAFNIANAVHVPGSSQESVVIADMHILCLEFCPSDIPLELKRRTGRLFRKSDIHRGSADSDEDEEGDGGSDTGSMSGSRQLTKPRFLEPEFMSMAQLLDGERSREVSSREVSSREISPHEISPREISPHEISPREQELETDIFDAS